MVMPFTDKELEVFKALKKAGHLKNSGSYRDELEDHVFCTGGACTYTNGHMIISGDIKEPCEAFSISTRKKHDDFPLHSRIHSFYEDMEKACTGKNAESFYDVHVGVDFANYLRVFKMPGLPHTKWTPTGVLIQGKETDAISVSNYAEDMELAAITKPFGFAGGYLKILQPKTIRVHVDGDWPEIYFLGSHRGIVEEIYQKCGGWCRVMPLDLKQCNVNWEEVA